ncbi:MAG: EAL domain-containing protein [Geobacteraceae bacterium]|nr:EAL domain-containing protein [Geobacteraceae bacterium]
MNKKGRWQQAVNLRYLTIFCIVEICFLALLYSSLSYLKRLTADTLKIDRSFIKDLPNDKEDSVIAEAILALAKNLGMQVVAEGVETEEQLEFLKARTCQYVQGYYFAKPMPADEFLLFAQSLKNGGNITC